MTFDIFNKFKHNYNQLFMKTGYLIIFILIQGLTDMAAQIFPHSHDIIEER